MRQNREEKDCGPRKNQRKTVLSLCKQPNPPCVPVLWCSRSGTVQSFSNSTCGKLVGTLFAWLPPRNPVRPAIQKGQVESMSLKWVPKSGIAMRDYSRQAFVADLIAGITVGLVALPLAMAFAIASGVPPQAGLYCAVIAGFLISALGGSRVQIGGPTGAFVVVVFGIVTRYGIDGLYMCTLLAGILLVLLGATGLGAAVSYIPRPVIVGFTNGIAVLIASTQIRDFFGLQLTTVPG